jgi:hypothetical protein
MKRLAAWSKTMALKKMTINLGVIPSWLASACSGRNVTNDYSSLAKGSPIKDTILYE